jgi:hypothetical protein
LLCSIENYHYAYEREYRSDDVDGAHEKMVHGSALLGAFLGLPRNRWFGRQISRAENLAHGVAEAFPFRFAGNVRRW